MMPSTLKTLQSLRRKRIMNSKSPVENFDEIKNDVSQGLTSILGRLIRNRQHLIVHSQFHHALDNIKSGFETRKMSKMAEIERKNNFDIMIKQVNLNVNK